MKYGLGAQAPEVPPEPEEAEGARISSSRVRGESKMLKQILCDLLVFVRSFYFVIGSRCQWKRLRANGKVCHGSL